jgi:hypothetical protein
LDTGARGSDILGLVVLMLLLLIGLLISVGALLFVAGAVTRHILRQRRLGSESQAETIQSETQANKQGDAAASVVEPDSQKGGK